MCPFWPAVKELVLNGLNGKVQGTCVHFLATTLQIPVLWPTGAGELSGSDSRTESFWPEPVLRTHAFHLRTDGLVGLDRLDRPDRPDRPDKWKET